MSDFIDDGYTEQGFIAAESGIHGPLEFTYRPVLITRRDAINSLYMAEKFDQAAEKVSDELARSVQDWSLKDSKGQPVAKSAANMRRIKPRLFDKLWQIVSGAKPSDNRSDVPDLEGDGKN